MNEVNTSADCCGQIDKFPPELLQEGVAQYLKAAAAAKEAHEQFSRCITAMMECDGEVHECAAALSAFVPSGQRHRLVHLASGERAILKRRDVLRGIDQVDVVAVCGPDGEAVCEAANPNQTL